MLQTSPLLAVGTVDENGWPWASIWGGQPGFGKVIGPSVIGIKTMVDSFYDPVVEALLGPSRDGEVTREAPNERPWAGLAIDPARRTRVKLAGRMIGGALENIALSGDGGVEDKGVGQVQLTVKIEESLGNCPKYINKKEIVPKWPNPRIVSDSLPMPDRALDLLRKADMFFLSSSTDWAHMGLNHRGGPPGFVRVQSNEVENVSLVYPELSGNRLYQTLGNLQITPRAGLVFPDFDTGNALYLTGTTKILVGKDASSLLPHSNLLVKLRVERARFVQNGLPFRGGLGERSPYNPPVRFLASEKAITSTGFSIQQATYAILLSRELLTPTIARFRFRISDPKAVGSWKGGQYVTLGFEHELDQGYSHMREDDPKSLNDDYLRTFTISSEVAKSSKDTSITLALPADEFEITIRNVGVVTDYLFRYNIRAGLEVPLNGFGGEFIIEQAEDEIVSIVAGGIGITPLLAQLSSLDVARIRLFWSTNLRDIGLVRDTMRRCPELARSTKLFVSSTDDPSLKDEKIELNVLRPALQELKERRLMASDVKMEAGLSSRYYLCTSTTLRKSLLEWLVDKQVVYEGFDY
ncbi:hypothetical protein MMC09_001639 [Bachmanniomyces sp. S44760]|nr:hypothetical protein [Bachmanniomyces sp. S44760]